MNKLLPTIGPASESYHSLKKILKFSNLIRINGAHNTLLWHKKISYRIKNINKNAIILLDLPGVKPRTNNDKNYKIKKNQNVIFFYKKCKIKNVIKIKVTTPFPKILKKSKYISLSDGKYLLKIVKLNKNFIETQSLENFEITQKKGINIPNSIYNEKVQKKMYMNFLKKTKGIKFDAIGLSYVQSADLINYIRKYNKSLVIVSKIENVEGLKNIDQISKASDVIMVDRGDLAAEIGEHRLFSATQDIARVVKNNGKALIIATENLESMIYKKDSKRPTKSEIISLGFSTSLHADRIMLSDETATSKNWNNIINWLSKFLKTVDQKKLKPNSKNEIFWNAVQQIKDISIVIFSRKGYAIDKIKQINDTTNLTVFTDSAKTKSLCEFKANTSCFLIKRFAKSKSNRFIYDNIKKYKKNIFYKQKHAALIYISYPRKNSRANTLTLISKKDF